VPRTWLLGPGPRVWGSVHQGILVHGFSRWEKLSTRMWGCQGVGGDWFGVWCFYHQLNSMAVLIMIWSRSMEMW
jgi:hypothetical protein